MPLNYAYLYRLTAINMYKFPALILLLFITTFTAYTQATDAAPSPRNQPAIAFDSKRGKLFLFGGIDQAGRSLNDTWEWDGAKWEARQAAAAAPPARAAHSIAYDAGRGRIVLFGGQTGPSALADTWEWDGNAWTKLEPKSFPPGRVAHALVYDRKRKRVILFGGTDFATKQTFNDTWEWDGETWTPINTASAPEGRFHHTMAFDSKRNRVVLFGGNAAVPPLNSAKFKAGQRGDTWEFDGKDWKAVTMATLPPPARDHHAMAYDASSKKVILFGGFQGGFEDGTYLRDTWSFDGKTWARVVLERYPAARGGKPGMTYDTVRKALVLFGGGSPQLAMNDLWLFNNGWSQKN